MNKTEELKPAEEAAPAEAPAAEPAAEVAKPAEEAATPAPAAEGPAAEAPVAEAPAAAKEAAAPTAEDQLQFAYWMAPTAVSPAYGAYEQASGKACGEACGEACGCHRVQVRCPFPAGANAGAPKGTRAKFMPLRIEWPAQDVMQAQNDASPTPPNSSGTSKTSGRGPSESPGEVVQVCLRAGRDAAFCSLPLDMLISHVKRLLLATWCSNLGDQAKPPVDVAAGIQRLWHETWLKCSGRSLDEGSTLRASNIGADATIDLQVCCPPTFALKNSLPFFLSHVS